MTVVDIGLPVVPRKPWPRDDSGAALARSAARALDGAPAAWVLGWALDRWPHHLAVAASMADTVVAHMAAQLRPGIPVLFVDTGYHFAETLGTAAAAELNLPITLIRLEPELTVEEQDARFGPRLYERDPDLCCAMRKVQPLDAALAPYAAWVTGLRRSEAGTRARARAVEWDAKRRIVKVNPIVDWSDEQVAAYVDEHDLLVNPLLGDGYASIGCAPCTRRVAQGEDARAGRWSGFAKTECGLH